MKTKAFTLLELLVVVAVIGILAAVGMVSYNEYMASARKAVAKANFENIVKLVTTKYTMCLLDNKNDIKNDCDGNNIIISCKDALADTERGVRAFPLITECSGIRNPYPNPFNGKTNQSEVNAGAWTQSGIESNHNNWPGLITITSVSPNKLKKSVAVYTKIALDEPIINKVIILE